MASLMALRCENFSVQLHWARWMRNLLTVSSNGKSPKLFSVLLKTNLRWPMCSGLQVFNTRLRLEEVPTVKLLLGGFRPKNNKRCLLRSELPLQLGPLVTAKHHPRLQASMQMVALSSWRLVAMSHHAYHEVIINHVCVCQAVRGSPKFYDFTSLQPGAEVLGREHGWNV